MNLPKVYECGENIVMFSRFIEFQVLKIVSAYCLP